MRLAELDYDLPRDRIAQTPVEPRDSARLMVVRRSDASIAHHHFRDLPDLLSSADLIVANDSRVLAARLFGTKPTGGAVEVLLLAPRAPAIWSALIRGRVKEGTVIHFGGATGGGERASAVVMGPIGTGVRELHFDRPAVTVMETQGVLPLPPYIREPPVVPDRYQTVYARVAGSAAAPTAGLHFTPELIKRLETQGVGFAFVTLHVGADTFVPVQVDDLTQHPIHREWCSVPAEAQTAVANARARGGKVVAIGTTTVRALESAARAGQPYEGWTDLFILPGHCFAAVDAMVTNFHLPRTTLLGLVAAFAGPDLIRAAYRAAIDGPYRFYSFGDAMLIL